MESQAGVRPALVVGARGAFEVIVGGRTVFSKLATGRFPTPEEVLAAMRAP